MVGEFLTPAVAASFAQAFGTYVGGGRVVVGRDTRASGQMLKHAVTCGLLAAGCEVVDVGVLPTPTIQIYVASTQARGGLALTASHNPPEYNALKLFNAEGLFFNSYERGELLDLYHQSAFREATNAEIRGNVFDTATATRLHIDRVLAQVDVERIRAPAVPRRARRGERRRLGDDARLPHQRPRLRAPRHLHRPDEAVSAHRRAAPRHARRARRPGASTRAQIGFAQDPDGDRLAVVDETGHVLDNDDVLALAVDAALRRVPGDVVVNLTTSSVIDDVARAHGRRVHRTAVGEANVVERMRSFNAAIGGEGSNGGIIFPAVHLCRDSYTGMALLLDRMAETGQPISALVAALPRYVRRLTAVRFEHGRLGLMIQGLEQEFPDARTDRTDGLKLHLPAGLGPRARVEHRAAAPRRHRGPRRGRCRCARGPRQPGARLAGTQVAPKPTGAVSFVIPKPMTDPSKEVCVRLVSALLAVCLCAPLAARAQESTDLATVDRIKAEAFERSQVAETLRNLTDVYGPRLTASPQFDRAARWTMERLQGYGLANVHLEAWGPFGRSWEVSRYAVEQLEPYYVQLDAAPLAWSGPTAGPVEGVPLMTPLDVSYKRGPKGVAAAFEVFKKEWAGKLRGRILLLTAGATRAAP